MNCWLMSVFALHILSEVVEGEALVNGVELIRYYQKNTLYNYFSTRLLSR